MNGLRDRLQKLQVTGTCCQDLDQLVSRTRSAPGIESARARYEALADTNRLLAAAMIKRSPGLCACEIQAGLGISHATVSHHMKTLSAAGIVTGNRDGRWMRYHVDPTCEELIP